MRRTAEPQGTREETTKKHKVEQSETLCQQDTQRNAKNGSQEEGVPCGHFGRKVRGRRGVHALVATRGAFIGAGGFSRPGPTPRAPALTAISWPLIAPL